MRNIILLSFLFCNIAQAQWNQIYLVTQAEVDQFPITHPSNIVQSSLTIRGEDITNLDSLYHIDTIEQYLAIWETSVDDLSGLRNLIMTGSLDLAANPQLNGIEGLESLKHIETSLTFQFYDQIVQIPKFDLEVFPQSIRIDNNSSLQNIENINDFVFERLTITRNGALTDCAIDVVCDHILSFSDHDIRNNGNGCNDPEEIKANCANYNPCNEFEVIYSDDFEDWEEEFIPAHWEGEIDSILFGVDLPIYNIQSMNTPNNGQALRLNSFSPSCAPGIMNGSIKIAVEKNSDFINLNFDQCFASIPGQGLGVNGHSNVSVNGDRIWQNFASSSNSICDSMQKIELCNIPISANLDSVIIEFSSNRVSIATGSSICSSWVIDNIEITSDQISNLKYTQKKNEISIIQNPVFDKIQLNNNIKSYDYEIYDLSTNIIKKGTVEGAIDVDTVHPGVYILKLQKQGTFQSIKFLKI